MHRPVPHVIRIALSSILVAALFGCGADTTAPDVAQPPSIASLLDHLNGNRVHRAASGVVFTINHQEGTLRASGGKPIYLSPKMIASLEKDFDLINVVEVRRARLKRSPDYGRQLAQVRRNGVRRLIRASTLNATTPAATAPSPKGTVSQFAPRISSDIYDGMDQSGISCLDIAQNIMAEQPIYDHALAVLDEALLEVSQAGARDNGAWSPDDYAAAALLEVAEWNYQVELFKMNFLAVLYNSYYCWDNHWTDASVSGGGGGGGGGGSSCYEEWGSLEASYDGGMTWTEIWSGYYTVCGEMQM